MASSCSSSSSRSGRVNGVFLSCRGADVRMNLVDDLYYALVQKGIQTFLDEDELHSGEDISPQLAKVIQESKISVVVFSKSYVSSRRCFNILVKILECKRTVDQVVLPIYFDIDLPDVYKFFDRHNEFLEREIFNDVISRIPDLRRVGLQPGWNFMDFGIRHRSILVQIIVQNVMNQLHFRYSEAFKTTCSSQRWTYDVYMSFWGEDTFIYHLWTALIRAGICTCRDNELSGGKQISSQLPYAIRESRISLVVFSKNYASSRWCLDELVEILKCKRTIDQIVLPIFYDIHPSDVRKQAGNFAAAFVRHEQRVTAEKVIEWREALVEAANLCGWELNDLVNGNIPKLIQNIVEDVLRKLNFSHITAAKYPVGLHSRVRKTISRLSIGTDDVRIVGIKGMGGIGKTTIAKAVYNQVFHRFQGSSFLANIKEAAAKPLGLIPLQEQLLSDILMSRVIIEDVYKGINLIKNHLHDKRFLVVLDDVDQLEQLHVFMGDGRFFCPGSRIIITTRNAFLLRQIEVDYIYEVDFLDRDESLQLFSQHAFRCPFPVEEYRELSNEVVNYAGGLPLALAVLGCLLFRRTKPEWKTAIEKLQKIPNQSVYRKLRLSFDALDVIDKSLFLDIACFFVGRHKEYVNKILHGRGFCPVIGLQNLIERSLVAINERNEIRMHDLLRDMGREIIRQNSLKHPGRRSRIWSHEDAWNVLIEQTGTEMVEGLALDVRESELASLSTESFANMHDASKTASNQWSNSPWMPRTSSQRVDLALLA